MRGGEGRKFGGVELATNGVGSFLKVMGVGESIVDGVGWEVGELVLKSGECFHNGIVVFVRGMRAGVVGVAVVDAWSLGGWWWWVGVAGEGLKEVVGGSVDAVGGVSSGGECLGDLFGWLVGKDADELSSEGVIVGRLGSHVSCFLALLQVSLRRSSILCQACLISPAPLLSATLNFCAVFVLH